MPCNAKKYEAARPEFRTEGIPDVDLVMTTTDVIAMFAERHIDPLTIKPVPVDAFFGKVSGAGIIFGASGGVAEAALRLASERLPAKNGKLNYEAVRACRGSRKPGPTGAKPMSGWPSSADCRMPSGSLTASGPATRPTTSSRSCLPGVHQGSGNPAPPTGGRHGIPVEVLYRLDQEAPIRTSQIIPGSDLYKNWLESARQRCLPPCPSHNVSPPLHAPERIHRGDPCTEIRRRRGVCIGTNCTSRILETAGGSGGRVEKAGLLNLPREALFCTDMPGRTEHNIGRQIISTVNPDDAAGIIDRYLCLLNNPLREKNSIHACRHHLRRQFVQPQDRMNLASEIQRLIVRSNLRGWSTLSAPFAWMHAQRAFPSWWATAGSAASARKTQMPFSTVRFIRMSAIMRS